MKETIYNYICKIIPIIVLSIIYFYVKTTITQMDIISYYFILISYMIFICAPYLSFSRINNTLLKIPVYSCSFVYLFIQIILAIIIAQSDVTFNKNYVLVQSVLTGIYLIILFSILYVNENTSKKLQFQKLKINFLDELKHKFILLSSDVTDTIVKENIESLIDYIHVSPITTERDNEDIENMILNKSEILKEAIENKINAETIIEHCKEIKKLLYKRNIK